MGSTRSREIANLTAEQRENAICEIEKFLTGKVMIDIPRCIVCNGDVLVGRKTRIEYKSLTNPHFLLTDGTISDGFEIVSCQSMCRGSGCMCSLDELEHLSPRLAAEYRAGKTVFLIGGRPVVFVSGKPYRIQKLPVRLSEQQKQKIQKELMELHSFI